MYPPLDLRQLACFVAAAETGTMTAAGERLTLSQSAVSLAVRALERRLGTQLLVRRTARTLLLTAAGARLLPAARALLAHADELQRTGVAPRGGIAGPLTVGCFSTLAPLLLPELLESFTRAHPNVELDFVDGPVPLLEAAMRDGRCDLAILDTLDVSADIAQEPLFSARAYALLAASDPLAERDAVTLGELAERDMILFDLPPSGEHLQRIFTANGYQPRVRHRTGNHELVRALVGRGLGFALLLTGPAHDRSHEGLRLAARPLAGDIPDTGFALAHVSGARPTRQAAAFARHCREHAGRTFLARAPHAASGAG